MGVAGSDGDAVIRATSVGGSSLPTDHPIVVANSDATAHSSFTKHVYVRAVT